MTETATRHLTEITFDETLAASEGPVVVDFWAPWCGPCRAIAPALEEIARELEGRAIVGKVNVDEAPALAARFGVQAIPTLLFFRDGALKETLVGAVPKAAIVERLTAL
jgi:thioredoxin